MKSFGIDSVHYIAIIQMSYSLFFNNNNISNEEDSLFLDIFVKESVYQMKIDETKVMKKKEIMKIFMNGMNNFHESRSTKLIDNDEINVFI